MIEVVGVAACGVESMEPTARALVEQARVVVGSPRLLGLLPAHPTQTRLPLPSPLRAGLPDLVSGLGEEGVVVLATGDPMVSGIGTTLVDLLGADAVRIHPALSSVALARARMRWSAEQSTVLSLVSTPVAAIRRLLSPDARIVVLSAGPQTPGELAHELVAAGWPDGSLTVLGDLGTEGESLRRSTAADWDDGPSVPRLNVVAVHLPGEHAAYGMTAGLPDEAFEHDGQLTKREIRAAALATLRPMPGQLLWDLGAGAGSVGIEWARAADRARTIAVERDPDRAARIARNAVALGVPGIRVVQGETDLVTAADHGLPDPDAVFVGGGASTGVVDAAWGALRPHGRIVLHAVTLDTEAIAVAAFRAHGGELRRLSVERAEPLGHHLSWTPARPVVQWSCTKEGLP
ncbi:precorrin-6y C5,15-methyltransferase (decarboxylating) subunit CbiE [Nostocoides sp. HKS02]|uniref:precorrin-6y C5,15-methyltransferase (decarboxylating) subunit CbiE n=1 Tax=Nostocoides sp. HKS02 TaxID=1813880 RepID=UPI001E40BA02|nr:precorrin-6y C5,15-methyltransferase (decarboxylating) subunit CbiE [Tetrasphaera sp. HKS02]